MTEAEKNKAVHIISIPRSGSTLFMRVIAKALGNATIYSEPGVATFAYKNDPNWVPHLGEVDIELRTFEGVEQAVLRELASKPVVVKDVIHTVRDFLEGKTNENSTLVKHPNTRYIILFRDPYSVAVSLSRIIGEFPSFNPVFISFKYLFNLYAYLVQVAVEKPIVVDADAFFNNFSVAKVKALLDSIGMETLIEPSSQFILESLDKTEAISEWSDPSNPKAFQEWHDRAAKTTRVDSLPTYSGAGDGQLTFEAIAPEFRNSYIKSYEENSIYYKMLLELALQI